MWLTRALTLAAVSALPTDSIADEDGTWGEIVHASPPSERVYHSANYDPIRERMLVFGHHFNIGNQVWVLTLAGASEWGQLDLVGSSPSARHYHTSIYDSAHDRLVVFGGGGNPSLNDVWILALAGTPGWTQLAPSGSAPTPRNIHAAIYDAARERMVVFGGYGPGFRNDTWALSLAGSPSWIEIMPSGVSPSPRAGHTAIYDPLRDRMLVFGGTEIDQWGVNLNDVWALSLSGVPAWSQLTPTGSPPAPRRFHSAVYDPARDRMVVFGGASFETLNDAFALTLQGTPHWNELDTDGIAPSSRLGHSAIYDPVADRMIVFAGEGEQVVGFLNDTWTLNWVPPTPFSNDAGLLGDSGHATGASWVDLDLDGDLDLHVLRTQDETDRSYENQGGGTFTPLNPSAPLDNSGNGQGMDWGDYDNDGDLDLYLVNSNGANKLYRNNGAGSFSDATTPPLDHGTFDTGANWVDFDRDGLLDIYLTTSFQPNRLYRNLGSDSFVETAPTALALTSQCPTSAWGDYDDDGDSDAYISVLGGANALVRNDGGGAFANVTTAPLNDAGSGQGVAWGDYDNDTDLDLYLCNFGQPNRLFRNDGGSSFVDVASGPLADANQGQSGTWADFDNDRDLDLVLTNFGQPSYVLRNDGSDNFVPAATLGDSDQSLGAAWGDYDEDGDEDLFVANYGSPDKLFRNDVGSDNNWLTITLQGTVSNRCGIGTRVTAVDLASGTTQTREHGSNHGFWSVNAPLVHFGLGSSTQVDVLVVRWPSGILDSFVNVFANHRITIVESEGIVGAPPLPPRGRLAVEAVPNPFRDETSIRWTGSRDGLVGVRIFDVQGRLIRSLSGEEQVRWNGLDAVGSPVQGGVYFYRLTTPTATATGKVVRAR